MSVSNSRLPGSDMDTTDSTGIRGGTDNTIIGNTGDKLRVEASFQTTPTTSDIEYPSFCIYSLQTQIGFNKSMVSIVNAAGSGVVIRVREIRLVNRQNSAVTGIVASFDFLRCTGHSAGTSLTPYAYDTNDVLNANVTARTGATITGETTNLLRHFEWSTDEWTTGAPDTESADHAAQLLIPAYLSPQKVRPITIRDGQGLTLKQTVNSTVGQFDVLLICTQESP